MLEEGNDVKSADSSSPRSSHDVVAGKPNSPKSPRQPRRVKLTEQQFSSMAKDEIMTKWRDQELYLEYLEAQAAVQEGELVSLKESEDKYKQLYAETSHKEKILVRKLASKEQELHEYVSQISEMKAAETRSVTALRSTLLDPAVNILIQKLRQELISTKAKLEDTQNELSAWKFTPDSNTGKRLMAKCRLLYQENEELGRMIASGRIAKLEGELALQKGYSEEVKKSQTELDEFLQDLDEDVEGMQSTIYFLQQELRKARESVTLLQQENETLKKNPNENNLTNGVLPHTPSPQIKIEVDRLTDLVSAKAEGSDTLKGVRTPPMLDEKSPVSNYECDRRINVSECGTLQLEQNDESSRDSPALIIKVDNEELSDREEEEEEGEEEEEDEEGGGGVVEEEEEEEEREEGKAEESCISRRALRTKTKNKDSGGKTNEDGVLMRTIRGRDRAKRDRSLQASEVEKVHKKKRRESILSLDYNDTEDEALVITNGETLQSDPE